MMVTVLPLHVEIKEKINHTEYQMKLSLGMITKNQEKIGEIVERLD